MDNVFGRKIQLPCLFFKYEYIYNSKMSNFNIHI